MDDYFKERLPMDDGDDGDDSGGDSKERLPLDDGDNDGGDDGGDYLWTMVMMVMIAVVI